MSRSPQQLGDPRPGRSRSRLVSAYVLAAGIALTSVGVAGATPAPGSYSALDAEWDASWAAYQFENSHAGSALVTRSVVLPVTIDAPVARVFPAYSNLDNSLGRHPFLRGVLDRGRYTGGDTQVWEFIALEDIPAGPVSIPGRTVGRQEMHAADHWYSTDTWDMPGVITHQKVTFGADGGATTVTEHLTFSAPAALIDYTVKNGVSSHIANQQAMKRDIENGTL